MQFDLTTDQKDLQRKVRQFAQKKLRPIWREVDDVDGFSWDVVHLLAAEGILRFCAPEEYGGLGLNALTCSLIREELSQELLQADDTFLMSWAKGLILSSFGTEEQKRYYLPKIATGEILGSGAITEPWAGSDVRSIKTTATKEGDFWVLNGEKKFISNGGVAKATTVLAKTDPSLGGDGLSFFVVDTEGSKPGLSSEIIKLTAPHPCYHIRFDNYRIGKDSLLGRVGDGLKMAMSQLAKTRVTVGAIGVGIAQAALNEAITYAKNRVCFGRPLIKFQETQMKLADMATSIEAGRMLVYHASSLADTVGNTSRAIKESSMAKLFCTEMAQRVVDLSLQIHGGNGLIRGTKIEYLYRAVRMPRIYEGASEIQKLTITRSMLNELDGK
jgi:alkylation response protein AidB-like acyl-CoA dehydrogenase